MMIMTDRRRSQATAPVAHELWESQHPTSDHLNIGAIGAACGIEGCVLAAEFAVEVCAGQCPEWVAGL